MTSSSFRTDHVIAFAGGLVALAALGWWWLIFSKVVENDYISVSQAVTCIAGATDLCALAQALCTNDHLYGIRWYAPEAFWAGAAVLAAGVFLSIRPRQA